MDTAVRAATAAAGVAALVYAYRTATTLSPIRSDWSVVGKGPNGRVSRANFKAFCLRKHAGKLTAASESVYEKFLDRAFDAGTGLMLMPGTPEKTDLGRHCFSYCNLLAGEFYFQQVRAQHTRRATHTERAGPLACAPRRIAGKHAATRDTSVSARTRQHTLHTLQLCIARPRGRRPMRSRTALLRAAVARPWRMCSSSYPRSERSIPTDVLATSALVCAGMCVCVCVHAHVHVHVTCSPPDAPRPARPWRAAFRGARRSQAA